ncbi:LysR family transcriptional regulator [Geomicrobium sp. JCM 19039]|uniref:LysR family transcriptional regulator n=1 Tax=Geomicrobium sp. JCM 19039 TaxID=1460636 RepID=UPI00045F2C60|nr:LysR family transcriptional regulator [Geomicrobium sp. JCM 19039]GAK13481.1 LysR family transcriptional regulator YeiE [Geomicrobium sp. JCM 19039]
MKIHTFELFCLIAEKGSISSAAREAYLTQPSVTKSVRDLEEEFGCLLFNRQQGRISLTEAGKQLYPHARAIVSEFYNSKEAVLFIQQHIQSKLRIGASYTLGEYVLPKIISSFKQQSPGELQLQILNTPDILDLLHADELDLAFVEGEVGGDDFTKEPIATDEIVAIAAPTHPLAARTSLVIDDLYPHHLISREEASGTRRIVEQHLSERMKSPPSPYIELSTTQAVKSAVLSGVGYAFVSRLVVEQEIGHGAFVHIPIANLSIHRTLWAVKKEKRFEKPLVASFFTEVKQQLAAPK